MANSVQHPGSFRDPAGYIVRHKNRLYRTVLAAGAHDYERAVSSGLYKSLIAKGLLIPHEVVSTPAGMMADEEQHVLLRPELVPFVSYPYEWSFDQLKSAALLTLEIMQISLKHGMILKDATAYNVQFIGNRPVHIDTLSFMAYAEGDQWEGYKQFCEHFVAPLALAHYASAEVLKMQQVYMDGIPLRIAARLLPRKARLRPGLLAHIYVHNASQKRHQQGGEVVARKAQTRSVTPLAMQGLLASLERTIRSLRAPGAKTEWGEYYTFTNYSDEAFQAKRRVVQGLLRQVSPAPMTVWDIGANNGEFSELAAEMGAYTVAFDIDVNAVSRNVHTKRAADVQARMLPLVQDATNPSPAIGWAHAERSSLEQRGPADVVMALAIIHHLAIGNNVPLPQIASFLHGIGKHVIIEFVPKGDSKVDHLLASRKDIFDGYTAEKFEAAMERHFIRLAKKTVKGSKRSIYLYIAR